MKYNTASRLLATLTLAPLFAAGCAPIDEPVDDEAVAEAESAFTGAANLGSFFATRNAKPEASVGRGVGHVPIVCPSGFTEIAGTCWKGFEVVGATCGAGEEMDAGVCYPTCPLGYRGVGPFCWLDLDAMSASCNAFYDPSIAALAQSSGRAMTFGVGAGMAAGASVSAEVGIYYGEDGQYGCYTSTCSGVVTDVSVDMSISFGNFDGVDALTGDGVDLSIGAGIGVVGFTESVALDENAQVVGFVHQTSVGAGLSPIALGVSTCDTSLSEVWGPHPLISLADAPDGRSGNTLYRVASNGTLQMSHQAANGNFDIVNREIGSGWDLAHVFAAEGGHVYAIDAGGTLRYYHHDSAGAWDNWGTEIGSGWGAFTKVFAARFGEIYAIDGHGDLRRYTHDGSLEFSNDSGTVIGSGWNMPNVFNGGSGAFYYIDGHGDLLYYYYSTSQGWVRSGEKIGSGWAGFASVTSTGNGEIYAVTQSGDLLMYRHDVNVQWATGSGSRVGNGWDFGARGIIPAAY